MAINKVVYGQNTLIDLTNDTVTSNKMLSNTTAHDKSGSAIVGSIPSKSAQTYTPGTSNQTIAASQYLTGTQTILGDANLVASNIKDGVSIFGVNGTYSGSVDTANMYAGSTTPSAANIDDLWVDTSDEASDSLKSWDITVSSKQTRDYTLVSGDSWIQQHYANDTIMLLLVNRKISHAKADVILSLVTNGKTFAKLPNNDELIGLRSYVNSSGTASNATVTASTVLTGTYALNITSNGNVSIHSTSSNPLNVGTYRLYGWIIEGGFTN